MVKDIYKITNLINNKVYIGQSKNTKLRFKEHQYKYATSSISKINNAITKYGVENFKFEILEKGIENYNEREKYWIKFFRSNEREFGYNITEGGEDPPIISGEQCFFCLHSDDLVTNILNDIINSDMEFKDIAEKYNVRVEYVSSLNQGRCRRTKEYSYPLRKQKNQRKPEELICQVIELLTNTTLSFSEIARQLKITRSTVSRINDGTRKLCPQNINYPIRENFENMSRELKNKLITELRNRSKKFIEIAEEFGLSRVTLSRFNNGKIYRNKDIEYPIRKSSERVY